LSGVAQTELLEEIVPFTAGDGRPLNLVRVRGEQEPDRGPILLVHGAGVRADIFRAPVERTFVDALVEAGYDVWLENWRASIEFPRNEWNLDQAAVHDHPVAVRTVLRQTGADTLPAVIHCQGSTSFVMSAAAGLIPEVTTIVSNAVSFHPIVPPFSRVKLRALRPLVARLTPYLNPRWGDSAPDAVARAIVLAVRASHRECDNSVCRMVSFTYGSGRPALWSHHHLDDETHRWLNEEFGHVPLSFFEQMARCVERGRLVSVDGSPLLPADFTAHPPQTDARFVLLAGPRNRCFLPESQIRSFEHLERIRPGHHRLRLLPSYGHLDVFMGRTAARDVFPVILDELDRAA
jgi:hypothetical protein